jgi:phosphatidylglycerol:prolipoprotein diacylglycerol transferase
MHPFIDIFGRQIGTYGLCMAVAVLLVGTISILRGKKQGVVPEDILIVGACAISGALICGSALYIFITYSPEQIWQMITSGRIEELLGSGIVFYGGLIGGIFGALLGTKIIVPVDIIVDGNEIIIGIVWGVLAELSKRCAEDIFIDFDSFL